MIPLTIPEIKRLLAAVLHHARPARSHWFHQRTRLARDAGITLVS
jgi:hypothetical protein